jgi:hypothetical protein
MKVISITSALKDPGGHQQPEDADAVHVERRQRGEAGGGDRAGHHHDRPDDGHRRHYGARGSPQAAYSS